MMLITKRIADNYKVEMIENSNIAYKLHGKRGACYNLIRNQRNKDYMFITNKNGNVCTILGNSVATDKDGKLTFVSSY